jgi:hypothetical protein
MSPAHADALSSFDDIFVGLESIRMASPKLTKSKTKPTGKPVIPIVVVVVPDADADDADDAFPKKKKLPSPFTDHLPPDRTWAVAPVTEKSPAFLTWMQECQTLVDQHFGAKVFVLITKIIKNFLWITMVSKGETRVFAFVSTRTGDIHCPALFDEPFQTSHGNILDAITRLSVMTAWGVETPWTWLPTYPGNKRFSKIR